jgi:light-regulated signal transduction histidine kinase (bacteriophytochrome)
MDLHHSVKIFDPEVCPPGPNLNFIDEAIRRGGVIKSAVKLIERQDGSRFYARFNIAPVRDANGNEIAVVMMVRDVSEQVESERALARSNKELQDFAYVASHDLQEPLRMVVSYLSLLERKYGAILDAKGHEYIHFAVDGGERMRELIDDLLAYSRVDMRGKEFVPVDMTAVTAEMTILLKIPIEENNAEIVADPLPTVVADPTQMLELMQNLVSNAIKFHGPDRPKIAISASQGAGEWTFAVKDNGIGLNMQYADKIFQMFQRLHGRGEYPGTGIGLALCKRIVERHGGRIWVESEPGRGSVFYFTIPNAPRHGAKMVTTSGSSTTIGPCA